MLEIHLPIPAITGKALCLIIPWSRVRFSLGPPRIKPYSLRICKIATLAVAFLLLVYRRLVICLGTISCVSIFIDKTMAGIHLQIKAACKHLQAAFIALKPNICICSKHPIIAASVWLCVQVRIVDALVLALPWPMHAWCQDG